MTPELDLNWDETPDRPQPVEEGIYEAEIVDAPTIEATAKGDSTKLVVRMRIVTEGDQQGRTIQDHISTKESMRTKIKNLFQSAGLNYSGGGKPVTEDLAGKIVKIQVKKETYRDDTTGEERETSRVARYLFEE